MDGNSLHAWREIGEYFSMIKHCEMIYRTVLGWGHFNYLYSYRIIKQLTGHGLFRVTALTAILYYWT